MTTAGRWTIVFALAGLGATAPRPARADDSIAPAVRRLVESLDAARAAEMLRGADEANAALLLERGRLLLYEGKYDLAAAVLSRPQLGPIAESGELLAIARACARATAATVSLEDEASGVFVRLQDEDDRPFVPVLARVATMARDALARDLGVTLPRPLRIEVVRDLFTLAAMTGLPESAAETTGTVAVAKWGRVTLLSPRAVPHGYPWADTLAHEMTHLAETQASADRAPLWLQEGVAKREETRWRRARPLDDVPSSDAIAAAGLERGLGRPIDKLGASIAMLPSPEHAMVAFAEVTSFVRFWIRETGEQALPELLVALRDAPSGAPSGVVDHAMKTVTGKTLTDWNGRWLHYLSTVRRDLPPDARFGGHPQRNDDHRAALVGELVRGRGHPEAAARRLGPVERQNAFDPLLRHHLATALYALGRTAEADELVARIEDVHTEHGGWMALHAGYAHEHAQPEEAAEALRIGLELSPLDSEVVCQDTLPLTLPDGSPAGVDLCAAARKAEATSP